MKSMTKPKGDTFLLDLDVKIAKFKDEAATAHGDRDTERIVLAMVDSMTGAVSEAIVTMSMDASDHEQTQKEEEGKDHEQDHRGNQGTDDRAAPQEADGHARAQREGELDQPRTGNGRSDAEEPGPKEAGLGPDSDLDES